MHIYEEQYWADAQLSVKQLFFNFYLQTLGKYSHFMKRVPADKLLLGQDDFFDFDGYLEWQSARFKKSGDSVEFIQQLLTTQVFS